MHRRVFGTETYKLRTWLDALAALKALATVAASSFLIAGLAMPARAQNFTVNSTTDKTDQTQGDGVCSTGATNPDGSAQCTLRAAIQESNASSGHHVITLPAGTYSLTLPRSCTYSVTTFAGPIVETTVTLCLLGDIAIQGAGSALTIIDAGRIDRGAVISIGATVVLQGLTIQNAVEAIDYGYGAGGGCINNEGALSLIQTTLTGCTGSNGGGVYNTGTLNMVSSTITGNSGLGAGGGIYNLGTVLVSNSVLSFDAAPDNGGGLCNCANQGVAIVTETLISGNAASSGGGIDNLGLLTVTNATISGNQASSGGGIQTTGTATLNNLTITQNTATNAGGGFDGNNNFTLANSIIAGNTSGGTGPDCNSAGAFSGTGVSLGYNLIQNTSSCGLAGNTSTNLTGVNPMLAPLAANVMALLPGSPAIDAGNPSAPGNGGSSCAITDQRGFFRQGSRCDIGAFEVTPGLSISGISPAQGGSGGVATTVVSGNGIVSGATLQLEMSGQPTIAASPVSASSGQTSISGTFNLTAAAQGSWDVVVTNPDGTKSTLPGSFTVAAPQSPQIFATVQGRSAIRAGLPAVFSILVSNSGNTDVFGVPLTISAPAGFLFSLLFPVPPPPANPSQVITNWTATPLQANTPQPAFYNVPVFLPVVPAGYTGLLTFSLTLPPTLSYGDTFDLFVNAGIPFYNPGLDPNVVNQFVTAAEGYASSVIGATIPSTLAGSMGTYITNQLQTAIANGRNDLVTSLNGQSDAFSVPEFVMDLAAFATAEVEAPAAPASRGVGHADARRVHPDGGYCAPGTTCGSDPIDVPPPTVGGLPPGCSISNLASCGITPADCSALPGYHLSSDGSQCLPNGSKPCPFSVNSLNCRPFKVIMSNDPNDIAGPPGAGTSNFLPGGEPITYTITFENQATATAPAQKVVVTDQLDTANLDLSTFAIGTITFGNYQIDPPSALQQFTAGVDFRPSQDIQVEVQAALNPSTGLVTWTFSSIDPDTGQFTTDPTAGFLPPDVTPPQGLGTIVFTVMPKAGIATNAATCNQATVVFDFNPALNTNTFCNSFDVTPPVSHVTALPAAQSTPNFQVQWSGTDLGSGIATYSIFVSDNGGPFTAFQTDTTATSATFSGQAGHSYGFYSIATDLVGNVEAAKTAAEATTNIVTLLSSAQISTTASGLAYSRVSKEFSGTITVHNISGSYLSGPLQLVFAALPAGVTLANFAGTFNGAPYITLNPTGLSAGQSATVSLLFSDPSNTSITFTPQIYSGSLN